MEELRDGDVFGMGRKGYLCCTRHPSLTVLGQAVDSVQGVSFMVCKRRATPSTVPPRSARLGPSEAPRTPFPAENPPKSSPGGNSVPIARTNNKRQVCITQRLVPGEGRSMGSCSILWIITNSQNQSQGPTPCFRWDEKGVRTGKSPFLSATSFHLSQGSVLPHHTKPWGAPAPSHAPTTLIALAPSILAQLRAITMIETQPYKWGDLIFPATPRPMPSQACHTPLQALPATTTPPSALYTEIFHHSPLTKVPFLHE